MKPRDYKKEYTRDHASKKQKKHRAARNKARFMAGLKKWIISSHCPRVVAMDLIITVL